MKSKFKTVITTSILSLSIFTSYAFAQDASNQISAMIQTGQFDAALNIIEGELKVKPKDPLLKFQRGIALSGLARNDEAIVEFSKLTEEYPQLPEPYNNLAVLYSAKGDLIKAKTSLEMAIKSQPNYLTAYDNLGDIYTKLAGQYYEKASSLDPNNQSVKSKVNLLNPITSIPIGSRQIYNNAANAPFPSLPPTIASVERNEKVRKIREDKPKKTPKETKAKEIKEDIKSTPSNNNTPNPEQDNIIKKVNSWANAWSSKNVSSYLSHYSSTFVPEGSSRSAWEASRKSKIEDKGNINVSVVNPQVQVKGDTAVVKFKQIYKSDKFKDTTTKTLNMIKVNGEWQIKQEKGN